jgi:hypothetical protein
MAAAERVNSLVEAVAVAEFDILEGVTISHVHPPSRVESFKKSEIAALCIPDGGHKVPALQRRGRRRADTRAPARSRALVMAGERGLDLHGAAGPRAARAASVWAEFFPQRA